MNDMNARLLAKKQQGKKILVCYFALGDPLMGDSVERVGEFLNAGADVLELGIPYADPSLDGQVVRSSMERALSTMTSEEALQEVARLREAYPQSCLQIMTYFELIDEMGIEVFAQRCHEVGASAVLSPNVPRQREEELDRALRSQEILSLRFASFHLDTEEINELKHYTEGYVFLQAVDGGTGPRETVSPQVRENVAILKDAGVTAPVCAGFGVSLPSQAATLVGMGTDGVIVGSSVINAVLEKRAATYIASLRDAMDGAA